METKLTGSKLTITVDLNESLPTSSTGKTLIAFSSGGFTGTGLNFKGKPVKINLTAIVPK